MAMVSSICPMLGTNGPNGVAYNKYTCRLSMDKVVRFKIVVDSADLDSNRTEDTLKGFVRWALARMDMSTR